MKFHVTHRTIYEYAEPVAVSHHVARLKPRMTANQIRSEFMLNIQPEPAIRRVRTDYFGNSVCFFTLQELHSSMEVTAESLVEVRTETPPAPNLSAPWDRVVEIFRDPVSPSVVDPYQFVFDSPLVRANPELADYARESFSDDTPLLMGVADLNSRIFRDFKYDPKATSVSTPLEEVLEKRRGVCQDFAHLAIACLRSLGLPARYVSGYLQTRPPEGKERLIGADASHAWFTVYCPDLGWVDFDPTNDIMPGEEHITVAYGRDFNDVSPVGGIITGGGAHDVKVSVDVKPV
jgi:transglutaminase-like putative cysteine protease